MIIDLANIVAIVGERYPAERPDGAGEQRTQIRLGEDLNVECIHHASVARLSADQIAIVEDDSAGAFEAEHRANMADDSGAALLHKSIRIVAPHPPHFVQASSRRDIAVNEI